MDNDNILVFKRAGQERKVAINVNKILIVEPYYSMQKEIACIWVQGINKPIEIDDDFETVLNYIKSKK